MCDEILDYLFSKEGLYSKSYILSVVALLISSAMSQMYRYNTALAKWLALTNPDVELTTKIVIILSVAGVLEKHPEICAYLIYADHKGNNRIWYSPSLKKILEPQNSK